MAILVPPNAKPVPTSELVKEVLDETRELVRLEVQLAKNEMRDELGRGKAASLYLGTGAVFSLVGLALLLVGIGLAIHLGWVPAFVIGIILLVMGIIVGLAGYAALPKKPFGKTKARLETDLHQLQERAA